jgi:hypothetical protein
MSGMIVKCLCGQCEVKITASPVEQFYCHCDDCRAVAAGAYLSVSLYPSESATLVGGHSTTWVYKTMPRIFCAACGTLLFGEVTELGLRGVNASLLLKQDFTPRFHQQCCFADVPIGDDLPHFAGLPAMWGGSDQQIGWKWADPALTTRATI